MKVGSGCWATSHYSPTLEIKILGATEKEENKMKSKVVTGEILNKWEDTEMMVESILYLISEKNKLLMKTVYKDGSESVDVVKENVKKGVTRYDYDNKHGDYYVKEMNGNLGFYDSKGKFKEAKKIN